MTGFPNEPDLDAIRVLVAVADARGFRAAGARLGVTGSAVSQTIRRLEEQAGVALVLRTTRSVRLTDAGRHLYDTAKPALEDLRTTMTSLGGDQAAPRGTLRLHVASVVEPLLGGAVLVEYLTQCPQVQVELTVSDAPVDIVAAGFDAGLQLGEVIEGDMIAVPVTGDLRLVVVGSPDYFARAGVPSHPRDLVHHVSINWRPSPDVPPYRWEFTERGREIRVAVPHRVLTNDTGTIRRLARAGMGLAICYEHTVAEDVRRGVLQTVLEPYCAPFPGYYLYYPQKRHLAAPLATLVQHLQAARTAQRKRRR